jgi:transposase
MIHLKVKPDSVVYTDGFRSYNTLDLSELKHYKIKYLELVADKKNHINRIKNLWNQVKRVLRKYNGISVKHFYLFCKNINLGLIMDHIKNNLLL